MRSVSSTRREFLCTAATAAAASVIMESGIYDLAAPSTNAMKPAGEWNHFEITCNKSIIEGVLNGEKVTRIDLDQFDTMGKRPDGSAHKFAGLAFKNHSRHGCIGLQDHGSPCWYKNIKLKPLP